MNLTPEEYGSRIAALERWNVRVTSYKLGSEYYCTVENLDPGAVIARGSGTQRAEAEGDALAKARMRLGRSLRG